MQLEKQVCSLELAQKLKELGVKQESLFYWVNAHNGAFERELHYSKYSDGVEPLFSAFTVAELGEILSWKTYTAKTDKGSFKSNDSKHVADTEANVRAKMLVYLLEKKLITI